MSDNPITQTIEGNLREAISARQPALSNKLSVIADFVLRSSSDFIKMTSKEICVHLNTSEPTLIRFCRQFGFNGLADFRIGLALDLAEHNGPGSFVPATADRRLSNPQGKMRIAQKARELITEDRTLLLDNGSTLEVFAQQLEGEGPFTVMTSGLAVSQNLLRDPAHKVLLTGGMIEPSTASLSGRLVEGALEGMSFDTFVMGTDSIDPTLGFSAYSESEAYTTRAMVQAASRVIVLADYTKFRRPGLHRICGIRRVEAIITDRAPADDVCEKIEKEGAKLIVVSDIEDAMAPDQNEKALKS